MRCLLDPDASTVGLYTPDRYFMVIMKAGADGGPDPLVFVHEYWHYLQNISTLHGLKSFEVTQQLVPLFSATMNADGTSRGSDGLSDAQKERIVRFLTYRATLDGESARVTITTSRATSSNSMTTTSRSRVAGRAHTHASSSSYASAPERSKSRSRTLSSAMQLD
jgi:hypothetical protein